MSTLVIVLIVLAVIIAAIVVNKNKGGSSSSQPASAEPSAGPIFPCVLDGSINMPPMADIIIAAITDVKEAGLWRDDMSGEEAMELCSTPMPNANNFGGGGAYGGRYLTGRFHFEIDADGQRIDDKSWVSIFSDEHFQVTGGVRGDGGIGMGSIGGTTISGSIVEGKLVNGRISHGDGKVHIYGVLDGTYSK